MNILNKVKKLKVKFLPRTVMNDFSFFCFEVRKLSKMFPPKGFYGAFRSNFYHLPRAVLCTFNFRLEHFTLILRPMFLYDS